MKLKSFSIYLLTILALMSCGDDEPEKPNLSAAFDVAVEDLTVTLSNKSVEASTYAWDFGDGATSTETNPVHTYAAGGDYTIKLTATAGSESATATKEVNVSDKYANEGYIVSSVASSSAGATYYAGYYPDLPSGNLDLTQKQAYQRLQYKTNYNGFLYGRPTSGDPGLTKFAVNASTGLIEEVAEIALFDSPGDVTIINDELGFISYFGSTTIDIFNPMTMQLDGVVDMSQAKAFPSTNDNNGYNSLIYNSTTGKIYATAYTNNSTSPPFYDSEDVWVEVIDVASKSWEKTTVHPQAVYALFRGDIRSIIDEDGNTYLLCQGTYGIDQQIGPNAATRSRPQIIKINTDSEFDLSYSFNPINAIGFQNNFFQLMSSMVYADNNKVYALGTSQPDSPEIQALLAKLGSGTITAAEYDQLVFLVLYTESMSLIEVDLSTKTSTLIENPKTAGFAYPYMYYYDGIVYSQITSNGGAFNGFYRLDPNTNQPQEQFNITAGGIAQHFIDLSQNY